MATRSAPPTFDLYRELELDPSATPETIDAAWRSLVKQHHPDVNASASGARIRRLNVAHDWLSDPALRTRYDATRPKMAPTSQVRAHGLLDGGQPHSETGPRNVLTATLLFLAGCLISVCIAYVGAAVFGVVIRFANVTVFAVVLLGEATTMSLLNLVNNVVFAGLLGLLATASFAAAFQSDDDGTSMIVGTLAALAFTFGFPAFAASYLGGLVTWMETDGAGAPAVLAISLMEAWFVAGAIGVASMILRDRRSVSSGEGRR